MTDRYWRSSEQLLARQIDRIEKGDPRALDVVREHFDYLHYNSQRDVFDAIRERFERTSDERLAQRVEQSGLEDLASLYPQLTQALKVHSERRLRALLAELTPTKWGDLNATSPLGWFFYRFITNLPLNAIIGAKLRAWTNASWPDLPQGKRPKTKGQRRPRAGSQKNASKHEKGTRR